MATQLTETQQVAYSEWLKAEELRHGLTPEVFAQLEAEVQQMTPDEIEQADMSEIERAEIEEELKQQFLAQYES